MSDSDNNVFITQNSFREESCESEAEALSEAELAVNYLMNVGDRTLDEATKPSSPMYQPECSDISDCELVATCERLEAENGRFAAPVSDIEVQAKSRKR